MDKISHLIGPISLTEHYSKEYKKHIYIFGDRHELVSVCKESENKMKLEKFLDLTFKTTKKNIDLFLELDYVDIRNHLRYGIGISYIDNIYEYFKGCFQVNKSDCKIPNVRFHYSDIRNYPDNILGIYDSYLGKLRSHSRNAIKHKKSLKIIIQKMETKCSKMLDMNYKELEDFMAEEMWKMKVGKQFSGISNPLIKDALINMFQVCKTEKMSTDKKTISEILTSIKYLLDKIDISFSDTDKNHLQSMFIILLKKTLIIMSCIMDIYLLSRMFRKFNPKFSEYSGEPENIIIYVGNKHANRYRKFLKCIGFELINETRDGGQCIDITSFKQPFFS